MDLLAGTLWTLGFVGALGLTAYSAIWRRNRILVVPTISLGLLALLALVPWSVEWLDRRLSDDQVISVLATLYFVGVISSVVAFVKGRRVSG